MRKEMYFSFSEDSLKDTAPKQILLLNTDSEEKKAFRCVLFSHRSASLFCYLRAQGIGWRSSFEKPVFLTLSIIWAYYITTYSANSVALWKHAQATVEVSALVSGPRTVGLQVPHLKERCQTGSLHSCSVPKSVWALFEPCCFERGLNKVLYYVQNQF